MKKMIRVNNHWECHRTWKLCKPLERLSLNVIVPHKLDDLLLSLSAISVEQCKQIVRSHVKFSKRFRSTYRNELPRDKTRVLRLGTLRTA